MQALVGTLLADSCSGVSGKKITTKQTNTNELQHKNPTKKNNNYKNKQH